MKKSRLGARGQAREDEMAALSKAMTHQQRLEAAARLSAVAYEFHQAGIAYRDSLTGRLARSASGSIDDANDEGANEA